jgi:hypothetical protein
MPQVQGYKSILERTVVHKLDNLETVIHQAAGAQQQGAVHRLSRRRRFRQIGFDPLFA